MDERMKESIGMVSGTIVAGAGGVALGMLPLSIGEILILTVPAIMTAILGFLFLDLFQVEQPSTSF